MNDALSDIGEKALFISHIERYEDLWSYMPHVYKLVCPSAEESELALVSRAELDCVRKKEFCKCDYYYVRGGSHEFTLQFSDVKWRGNTNGVNIDFSFNLRLVPLATGFADWLAACKGQQFNNIIGVQIVECLRKSIRKFLVSILEGTSSFELLERYGDKAVEQRNWVGQHPALPAWVSITGFSVTKLPTEAEERLKRENERLAQKDEEIRKVLSQLELEGVRHKASVQKLLREKELAQLTADKAIKELDNKIAIKKKELELEELSQTGRIIIANEIDRLTSDREEKRQTITNCSAEIQKLNEELNGVKDNLGKIDSRLTPMEEMLKRVLEKLGISADGVRSIKVRWWDYTRVILGSLLSLASMYFWLCRSKCLFYVQAFLGSRTPSNEVMIFASIVVTCVGLILVTPRFGGVVYAVTNFVKTFHPNLVDLVFTTLQVLLGIVIMFFALKIAFDRPISYLIDVWNNGNILDNGAFIYSVLQGLHIVASIPICLLGAKILLFGAEILLCKPLAQIRIEILGWSTLFVVVIVGLHELEGSKVFIETVSQGDMTQEALAIKAFKEQKWSEGVRFARFTDLSNEDIQVGIGRCYFEGLGGMCVDDFAAAAWFAKAAKQDNAEAEYRLGNICYLGLTGKQDYVMAFMSYRRAAEQNHAGAQFMLGLMYEQRILLQRLGMSADKEAVKWYRQSAEQGFEAAQYALGKAYETGKGIKRDYSEALKWYHLSAGKGLVAAQFALGNVYYNGLLGVDKDFAEAIKWYRQAAEQGFAEAQACIGGMYFSGEGVAKDYAEGAKWFLKAAEQGVPEAQFNLGYAYYNGLGVDKDFAEAIKWYRQSADNNYAKAMICLGVMYVKGIGENSSFDDAIRLFRRADELGDSLASAFLGGMYEDGLGVEKNNEEARRLYLKAIERGEIEYAPEALERVNMKILESERQKSGKPHRNLQTRAPVVNKEQMKVPQDDKSRQSYNKQDSNNVARSLAKAPSNEVTSIPAEKVEDAIRAAASEVYGSTYDVRIKKYIRK